MTLWLERKEKILRHFQYIEWRCSGSPGVPELDWQPPGLELDRKLFLSKHPTCRGVTFEELGRDYGAPLFRTALARYVALINEPNLNPNQLERRIWTIRIPFTKVSVWHRFKFLRTDPFMRISSTADAVHVRPEKKDCKGRVVPGRFDTVMFNDGTASAELGVVGIDGKLSFVYVIGSVMKTL